VQRLDAHAVPGQQDALAPAVEDREREHPVQALDHSLAPLLIAMNEHLGVGLGGERVPCGDQLGAKVEVVVDLAVLDDPYGGVFVVDRLVSAIDVDD